jgi:hypothetical protein
LPETDDENTYMWTWQVILAQLAVFAAMYAYYWLTNAVWGDPTTRYPFVRVIMIEEWRCFLSFH